MSVAALRIRVERRANGWFVRNVPVTIEPDHFEMRGKATLTTKILDALGHRWSFRLRLVICQVCHEPFICALHRTALLGCLRWRKPHGLA